MRDAVVVVGSGMMGCGIGAMSALAGHKTILVGRNQARADQGLADALACVQLRKENALCTPAQAEQAVQLLSASGDMVEAAASARLVMESVNEDLALKQDLYAQLDAILPPEVAICSNTSGLRITDISAKCTHKARTMTAHFWFPAHLVPLVEVVMSEYTSEALAVAVRDELAAWGKTPVLVKKDLAGQLANRMFQALIREAVSLVQNGVASAEDVDTAISSGMAMRFPEWGPLKHLDAIGLTLGKSVQDTVLPDLETQPHAGDYLNEMVANGNLGVRSGKGFYDWSNRSIETDIYKRDQYIIQAVKTVTKLAQECD